jgi:hypothetical protein
MTKTFKNLDPTPSSHPAVTINCLHSVFIIFGNVKW